MSSTITLKAAGIQIEPNQLAVPEGALLEASNVNIARDNIIEPRRGFQLFGTTFGTNTDRLKQLLQYKTRLLRHWNNTLEFDSGTETNAGQELFTPFSTPFTEAQPGLRTKAIESNGNFYLTSSDGIQRISAMTPSDLGTEFGGVVPAGGIKALDLTATPILEQGNITGSMVQDSTVAYRALWCYNDLNNNLIVGVPSNDQYVYLPLGELICLDLNNTLQAIQNTADQPAPNTSLITDGTFVSDLFLPLTASATDIQANLVELTTKLDGDLIFANDTGSGVPLTISAAQIVNNTTIASTSTNPSNIATITFSSGDPSLYMESGSNINLTGFVSGENGAAQPSIGTTGTSGNINGPQVVQTVTSAVYTFIVSSANATAGAVYSNNGQTFTVTETISSGTTLLTTGTGSPSVSGVLTLVSGTGDAGITFSSFSQPTFASITFLTNATGNAQTFTSSNVNIADNFISLANNGFKNYDPVQFTVSVGGILPAPLVSGTTYYLGNVNTVIPVNTTPPPAAQVAVPGFQIFTDPLLANVVTITTTGTGTFTGTYFMPITATSFNSYEFESITSSPIPDVPTPDQELLGLQQYLQSIIIKLQTVAEAFPSIISAYSYTNYIQDLNITTSANVQVNVTIPEGILPNLFLQLYRSPGTLATGVAVLSELTASDELQQVFEGFPTPEQIKAGVMSITDIVPDSFLGADLYTNQNSGVGIANANAVPPFSLDVNKFQNVVFYANTRLKYLASLQLLGVSLLLNEYNSGTTPQVTISDGPTTNTYSFVPGVNQVTQIVTVSDTSDSLNGKYFVLNYNTTTNNPEPASYIGIITGTTTSVTLTAEIPGTVGNAINLTFNGSTSINSAISSWNTANPFNHLEITSGDGTQVPSNGTNAQLSGGEGANQYYLWYKTSGGTASDPSLSGAIGTEIFINTGDNATVVASKTNDAINSLLTNEFSSTFTANTILVTVNQQGYTTNSAAGTTGFTVTTPTPGIGQEVSEAGANFTTIADVAGNLAGKYFTITSPFNKIEYYVWYSVSGSGVNPFIPNATGIQINIVTNDSAIIVASKTATQLNALSPSLFTATSTGTTLVVTNFGPGPANPATAGTSGFTLNSVIPGLLQVLISNSISPSEAIAQTSSSLINVINTNPNEVLYAFLLPQTATQIFEISLESRTFSTPQYYITANNAQTGASFTPNLTPTIAVTSITAGIPGSNIVTTVTPHMLSTGQQVVLSATNSTPNADGLYTVMYLSPTTFSINTTIISPSSQGFMISAIDANSGNDNAQINNVSYSNVLQPDSVPLPNTLPIGDEDKAILRIMPLRDSLFVFKEDGLFRISGTAAPWTVQLFDSSTILTAPDSVAICKNVIYAWTTQGILSITEAGVSNPPISRPIDIVTSPLNSINYPNFTTATWGVGYDSDNSYTVFTVQNTTDTEATIAYRYCDLTTSWTNWDKTDTCGIVDITDNRLYLGAGNTNSIEQERKTFTRFDYADWVLATELLDNSYFINNVLQLPDVSGYVAGDVLTQEQNVTIYEFNALLQKLDLDTGLQSNSVSSISTGLTPTITTIGSHFLTTGDWINLSGTNTTPNIDGTYQVTVTSSDTFTITVPSTILTAGTTGLVKYNYYLSLQIFSGANLEQALSALVNRLNIEPSLIYRQQSSSIVSNSIANPTVITLATPLSLGIANTTRIVNISGNTGSVPSVNGNFTTTVIDSTHLSIPVNVTVPGTGGTLVTLDDYITATDNMTGTITNIAVDDPTVITYSNTASNQLVSNRFVQIVGTNSSPVIDGNYTITVVNNNMFTIPETVLIAGNSGTWTTLDGSFEDLLSNYNYIITNLNREINTSIRNYTPITQVTSQETIITSVNTFTNRITTALALPLVVGPLSVYQAIDSSFTYSPVTFQDPLNLKQVMEATLMFENKAFSNATLAFSSDLVPNFVPVPFSGNGNGSFGLGIGVFGNNFFGGGANAAPFRTYIPRSTQRCRYIVPQFNHSVALEKYSINGLTLTGVIGMSSRAYR